MIRDLGWVRPGTTLYLPFHTFDSNDPSASVTLSGLATSDIEIYKDGSVTQRASDSGYALLDTDGIDFDGITGVHGVSIDLADNTTAGFYAAGSQYWVVISSVTVDAATVNFVLCTFRIGYPHAILNTTIATLTNQTSFTLTAGPAEDDALNGMEVLIHDVASAAQCGRAVVLDYTGSTRTVTLAAGTTFTAAASDNVAVLGPSPLMPTVTGRTLAVGASGQADANVTQFGGSNGTFSGGRPEVNTSHWAGTAVGSATVRSDLINIAGAAVNAASAQLGVNVVNFGGSAGTFSSGRPEVNATHAAGTAWNSGAIGASTLASDTIAAAKIAAGAITAAKFAAGAIDAAAIANGAIDAATFAADVDAEILSYLVDDATRIDASALNTLSGHDPGETIMGATDLGTGSGFTAIPWNAAWDAEVQSEVEDALVVHRLDELLNADSDIDGAAPPTVGSVFHELMTKTAGSFTYDQTTDSLEALRDRGDAAWVTATSVAVSDKTGFKLASDGLAAVTTWTVDLTGSITGSLSGSVGSVTGNVGGNVTGTIGGLTAAALKDFFDTDSTTTYASAVAGSVVKEIADNAGGSALTAADIADAVWEEAVADHSGTSGSTAEALNAAGSAGDPWVTALPGSYTSGQAGHTVGTFLTGNAFTRLGAPAGASVSADIAAVKTDTGNLVSRITSTLFSGITSLAQWLGLIAGKQTGDSTARTELRATGAGSGTYSETTDSLEAVRDRGDAAWTTATGFSTHSAADVWAAGTRTLTSLDEDATTLDLDATIRAAVGLAAANLDTQLGAIDDFLDTEVADIRTRVLLALPDAAPGASGGLWILGTNAARPTLSEGITLTSSGGPVVTITGAAAGGSAHGINVTCSGSGGVALRLLSTGTSGTGIGVSGTNAGLSLGGTTADVVLTNSTAPTLAAAVWAGATRTLTSLSGLTVDTVTTVTNRVTANADQIEGADATDTIDARIDARLAAYGVATQAGVDDLPTNAELATALAAADDAVLAAVATRQATFTSATGVTFPTNFGTLSIDSSGRVVLQPTQTGVTIPTVTTVTNGVGLADGAITDAKFTVPAVSGVATGPVGWLQQLWRRFFKKVDSDAGDGVIRTYADNGTTVVTTQTVSTAGDTTTVGPAS